MFLISNGLIVFEVILLTLSREPYSSSDVSSKPSSDPSISSSELETENIFFCQFSCIKKHTHVPSLGLWLFCTSQKAIARAGILSCRSFPAILSSTLLSRFINKPRLPMTSREAFGLQMYRHQFEVSSMSFLFDKPVVCVVYVVISHGFVIIAEHETYGLNSVVDDSIILRCFLLGLLVKYVVEACAKYFVFYLFQVNQNVSEHVRGVAYGRENVSRTIQIFKRLITR